MKIEGDEITFSNGNTHYANKGIIGLSPELHVYDGYDGQLHWPREDWMDDDDFDGLLPKEQIELADHMLNEWQKFKDRAMKELE